MEKRKEGKPILKWRGNNPLEPGESSKKGPRLSQKKLAKIPRNARGGEEKKLILQKAGKRKGTGGRRRRTKYIADYWVKKKKRRDTGVHAEAAETMLRLSLKFARAVISSWVKKGRKRMVCHSKATGGGVSVVDNTRDNIWHTQSGKKRKKWNENLISGEATG